MVELQVLMAVEGHHREAVAAPQLELGAERVGEAQGAASAPANDARSQAAAAQVRTMDAQEAQAFDREAFLAALRQRIVEITPSMEKILGACG